MAGSSATSSSRAIRTFRVELPEPLPFSKRPGRPTSIRLPNSRGPSIGAGETSRRQAGAVAAPRVITGPTRTRNFNWQSHTREPMTALRPSVPVSGCSPSRQTLCSGSRQPVADESENAHGHLEKIAQDRLQPVRIPRLSRQPAGVVELRPVGNGSRDCAAQTCPVRRSCQ